MKKRIMALFLCVILCLSGITIVSGAEDEREAKSYDILFEIGIADEDIQEDAILSRAMLARLIAPLKAGIDFNLLGYKYEEMGIKDIGAGSLYSEYITYCVKNQLISIDENGTFLPEADATAEEAALALLGVLGYTENYAPVNIKDAIVMGIFDHITLRKDGKLSVSDMLQMILNTLEAKPLDEMYKNSGYSATPSDMTYLEKVYKIYKVNGIVFNSAVFGNSNRNDKIVVGGTEIFTNKASGTYDMYNGYKVRAYYKIEDDENKLVFLDTAAYSNELLIIYANDIENTSNGKIEYLNLAEKTVSVSINSSYCLKNGRLITPTDADFNIANGNITIINKGSSESVIIINEYTHLFTEKVINKKIYDTNVAFVTDLSDYDSVNVWIEGKKADLSEIKKDDVLSISHSQDRSNIDIVISRKTVEGSIVTLEENTVKIGTRTYPVSQYVRNNYKLSIGINARYYFDANNALVAIKYNDTDWKYGYFMGCKQESKLDSTIMMRILTSENKIVSLDLADSVDVNGRRLKNIDINNQNNDLSVALRTEITADNGQNISSVLRNHYVWQVIKYKMNFSGEIAQLCTAQINCEPDEDKLVIYDVNKKTRYVNTGCFNGYDYATSQPYDTAYFVPDISSVFYVPMATDNQVDASGNLISTTRGADDEMYKSGSNSFTKDDYDDYIYTYDVKDAGMAKCVLVVNDKGQTDTEFSSEYAPLAIVTKVLDTVDDDRSPTKTLELWMNGAKREIAFSDSYKRKDTDGNLLYPEIGDLIQIEELDGKIVDMGICMDYSAKSGGFLQGHNWRAFHDDYGKLLYIDEYGLKLETAKGPVFHSTHLVQSKDIYVFNPKNQTVTVGSIDPAIPESIDARNASYVYMKMHYGRATGMYVYLSEE